VQQSTTKLFIMEENIETATGQETDTIETAIPAEKTPESTELTTEQADKLEAELLTTPEKPFITTVDRLRGYLG
jgi:hypothetical protein